MIDPVTTSAAAAAKPAAASKQDATAKGFEQLLVQQLAQAMLKTAGDTGKEYASLLPKALADAVEEGGGLGLVLGCERERKLDAHRVPLAERAHERGGEALDRACVRPRCS